jgi:hypothetical protein
MISNAISIYKLRLVCLENIKMICCGTGCMFAVKAKQRRRSELSECGDTLAKQIEAEHILILYRSFAATVHWRQCFFASQASLSVHQIQRRRQSTPDNDTAKL